MISSGGIALALFLLLRGYRRDSRALVLGGWLVSAWQVSLGFTLGLQYCYLLAVLALIVVVGVGAPAPPGTGPERPPRRAAAVRPADPAAAARGHARRDRAARRGRRVYQSRPYLEVADKYPTAKRTIKEVKNYSVELPPRCSPPPAPNRVWGSVTAGMRAKVHSKNEDVFFPGGLILALAIVGLRLQHLHPATANRTGARDRRCARSSRWGSG